MKMLVSWIAIALTTGASTPAGEAPQGARVAPMAAPVESFILEEVEEINAEIERAAEAEEDWALDPIRIALNVVEQGPGVIEERRYLNLTYESAGGYPGACTITVITDAYQDDSMRGEWCRLAMERGDDDQWRLAEFRHAWRCYRGYADSAGVRHAPAHERFTSDVCL